MLKQQVRSVMRGALLNFSKKLNVSQDDFRIKMKLDETLEHPICIAMDKSNELSLLEWGSILGVKSIFKNSITSVIRERLYTISDSKKIDRKDINIRFYYKKEDVRLHLYNDGTPITNLELKDFV